MANLDTRDIGSGLDHLRQRARMGGHVHRAQVMVLAAGLAAFGIVAVAATMMTTLF